jgi:hypothetical protein
MVWGRMCALVRAKICAIVVGQSFAKEL